MSGRTRRAVGAVAILLFLGVYLAIAMAIAERLNGAPAWAQLTFFAVAGVSWGVPLKPLFSWMGRGRDTPRQAP